MRMRVPFLAAVAVLGLVAAAHADNWTVRDGNGVSQIFAAKLFSGVLYPVHVIAGMFGTTPTPLSVDAAGNANVNVVSQTIAATSTSSAAAITTAGTFQSVLAANSARKGFFIQNTSRDVEYVYVGANGGATTGAAIQLQAGKSISNRDLGLTPADNISMTSGSLNGATAVVVSQ